MLKWSLMLVLLCCSFSLKAHQPDISTTMLIEQKDGSWLLQLRAALQGFEYEVETHFGDSAYATAEEFQELVFQHMNSNLKLSFNGGPAVELKPKGVRLGHETIVLFEVVGVPRTIENLEVTNTGFADIYHNQSAFLVLKEGFAPKEFILDAKNQHHVKLQSGKSSFELVEEGGGMFSSANLLAGLCILALLGFIVFWTRRKPQE